MIYCIIGDHDIEQAFLDLGESVNLIPYLMYSRRVKTHHGGVTIGRPVCKNTLGCSGGCSCSN
jgi:hypothetical protein